MKAISKRDVWEGLFYLILIFVIIALVLIFFQMKKDGTKCISNPKEYLIEHFEKLTEGNITCTCLTDSEKTSRYSWDGAGYKIVFSSHDSEPQQDYPSFPELE